MFFLLAILNLTALGALFANHRLASVICFFVYTAINLLLLFQQTPTTLDPVFFVIQSLSVLVVYVALSSQSRDQVLTHQKKRGSIFLLLLALVIAVSFAHWFPTLHPGATALPTTMAVASPLPQGETFMLLAVVVLWMVGKNLYDRR